MAEETPTPTQCREWVRTGQRVQARTADGGFVQAVGKVISYTERPTVGIRTDDGNIVDWLAELCAPVDDPSKDPMDVVRIGPNGAVAIHTHVSRDGNPYTPGWRLTRGSVEMTDAQVAGWPVIGTVPATPAAEAQTPDGSRPPLHVDNAAIAAGAYGEKAGGPREFPADGPEPPADVPWLEWTHPGKVAPRFVGRHGDGWAWAMNAGDEIHPDERVISWPPSFHFSFREVPAGEVPQ